MALSSTYAQDTEAKNPKGQIGITFSSFGTDDVIRFDNLIGEAGYKSDKFCIIGISYLYQINRKLEIETGIEFASYKIIIEPDLPPGMDGTPHEAKFSLINIPICLRVNFLKYFFINGGLNLDFDAGNSSPIDEQTGIGGIVGAGLKYDFNCGASAFANPYLKAHSLLALSSAENHQRLMESGLRFGLLYRLK